MYTVRIIHKELSKAYSVRSVETASVVMMDYSNTVKMFLFTVRAVY